MDLLVGRHSAGLWPRGSGRLSCCAAAPWKLVNSNLFQQSVQILAELNIGTISPLFGDDGATWCGQTLGPQDSRPTHGWLSTCHSYALSLASSQSLTNMILRAGLVSWSLNEKFCLLVWRRTELARDCLESLLISSGGLGGVSAAVNEVVSPRQCFL